MVVLVIHVMVHARPTGGGRDVAIAMEAIGSAHGSHVCGRHGDASHGHTCHGCWQAGGGREVAMAIYGPSFILQVHGRHGHGGHGRHAACRLLDATRFQAKRNPEKALNPSETCRNV